MSGARLFGALLAGMAFLGLGRRDTAAAPSPAAGGTSWRNSDDVPAADTYVDDVELLARTIWGEARGEGPEGMAAVAAVIMNRANDPRRRWWGNTIREVIERPWQFTVWALDDANRRAMLAVTRNDPVYRTALLIALDAVNGRLADPTGGATHYAVEGTAAEWIKTATQLAEIGRHVFYKAS